MQEAVKGLTSHKVDIDQWAADVRGLQDTFNLNGDEMLRVFRIYFKHDWGRVRGTFTGRDHIRAVHKHDSGDLREAIDGIILRTRQHLVPPPNYDKINQCKQKEGEDVTEFRGRLEQVFKTHSGIPKSANVNDPYQQYLKQALMSGFLPKYS